LGTSAQPGPKTCVAAVEPPAAELDVVGADEEDELDEVGAELELGAELEEAGAAGAEPEPDELPQAARLSGTAAASAMRALVRRVNMSETP